MEMLGFEELYKKRIIESLQDKYNYSNKMQIPKIEKISLNIGEGGAALDSKLLNHALSDLTLIANQKAVATKARKAIASFKIRKDMSIGCKVTLRSKKAYTLLEKLVFIALPRSKDFKGFSKKNFDGSGNFSFGLKEQIVFPEINYDKIDKVRGLNVTIVTSAKTDEEAIDLLKGFLLPFNI